MSKSTKDVMNGWKSGTLKDFVAEFIVPQRDKPKTFDGTVPWCRIEDINGKYLTKSKSGKFVTEQQIESMPLRVFPVGTVMVSCSADLGRCAIIKNPLITNQTFIGLVPIAELDSEFLYYSMVSRAKELNELATGVTIKYLARKKFESLPYHLPPLSEQKKIIKILDKAFAEIETATVNTKQNISNARKLFKSQLNDAFNQNVAKRTIGEICRVVNGGTPSTQIKNYWGGKHAWITPAEMGKLDTPFKNLTKRTLTDEGMRKCTAALLPEYSVILSSRAPIGHLVINEIPMATNQGCRGLIPGEHMHFKYLYYFLADNVDLMNELGTGTTFKELSATKLKGMEIPCPSLPEQQKIIATLDKMATHTAKLTELGYQKLTNLAELKQSFLQQAFTGELTTNTKSPARVSVAEGV